MREHKWDSPYKDWLYVSFDGGAHGDDFPLVAYGTDGAGATMQAGTKALKLGACWAYRHFQ